MRKRRLFFALAIPGTAFLLAVRLFAETSSGIFHFDGPGKVCPDITSLIEQVGGRVDWGTHNLIAYDRVDPDTQTIQLWVMKPDGSASRCLSREIPALAHINVGNPAWHPSGKYLVVQATDMAPPLWAGLRPAFYRVVTNPGAGFDGDLWLVSSDGSFAAPLTHLPKGHGVLHAHFSHAGDQLLWSEMIRGLPQKWVMHLAHFSLDSEGPHLTGIQTLDPLGNAFYETHDFSPDDRQILFSTVKVAGDYRHMDIVRMDLAGGKLTYLTDPSAEDGDEHAHYSPDGAKILWMSSRGIEQDPKVKALRTDFWIMNADGSDKRRLTFFNEPGAPEYRAAYCIASDSSWSPDGRAFAAYLQSHTEGEAPDAFPGSILRIKLP